MGFICTKELEGFTAGKIYELLGCCGGEYIRLKDDNGEAFIVLESHFKLQ